MLELFISPCQNTCPAGINVPGYMSLVAEGRFVDAYNLIRQENPPGHLRAGLHAAL